jgi:hypothetical protein
MKDVSYQTSGSNRPEQIVRTRLPRLGWIIVPRANRLWLQRVPVFWKYPLAAPNVQEQQ